MLYDKNNIGKHLRQRVHIRLGSWHSYKHASEQVFKIGFHSFFGPLLETLTPGSISTTQKLRKITELFTIIRVSYPQWRPKLEKALKSTSLHRDRRKHLLNLQQLLEMFIPVVSAFVITDNVDELF